MNSIKYKSGDEITINIPFTYTIGDEGHYSGKILNSVKDMMEEVREELVNTDPEHLLMEVCNLKSKKCWTRKEVEDILFDISTALCWDDKDEEELISGCQDKIKEIRENL